MFSRREKIMGTEIEILISSEKNFTQQKAILASETAFATFRRLEQVFSRFRKDSELSRLNQQRTMIVSPDFLNVLSFAVNMAHDSNGIFNPLVSVAALGYSHDFWAGKFEKEKKRSLDFSKIKIEGNTIRLPENAMLDLGGCAKGYSVDVACSEMKKKFPNFVINAGGDLFAHGRFFGKKWGIGVSHPENEEENIFVIEAENEAIATSGSYRRKWMINGEKHHHLVSGQTGKNTPTCFQSVSVKTESVMKADAFATLSFLLGEDAYYFLEAQNATGYFF